MATLPHNSLPDSPPSQDADGDASNQTIEAPVSPPMASSDRDVPSQKNEVTEDPNLNEPLHAGLVIPLAFAVSGFRAIDRRRESASAKLTQLRMHVHLVLFVADTLRHVFGESDAAIQATDVRRLSLVQNALAHSDTTKNLFDMAMSELKACCDVLGKIEQEVAGSLKSFETISAGFETALTADEINVLHTLRCLPGEARLRRSKILTEVRSYW
ncbi:hypothetical protein KCU73_g5101, partial [Aureobasidium melanogenum]